MKLVNKTGYLKGAKTAKNPVNIIPSNLITTQGMAFPIKANGKTLYPNTGQYKFPTSHVVETPLKKKFQEGANKLEGDLISKVIMNRNKDKDFVQRAYAVGKNPKSLMFTRIGNPEEPPYQTKETHRMGWGEDDKGQTYMFPTIMNPNNEAVKVPNQYADYISKEGYKKATGMSYQKGTKIIKFKKGSKGVSLAFSRGEKDPKGGLTQKGVDKYNRATGGNLKMAVTTPPSKLKAGSKPANRRKSFCARMSGVKGPMKKPNGEPSRKALALRKWNC